MLFFPCSLHPSFPGLETLPGPQEMYILFSYSILKPIPLHPRSPVYGNIPSWGVWAGVHMCWVCLHMCTYALVYFVIPEVECHMCIFGPSPRCASSTCVQPPCHSFHYMERGCREAVLGCGVWPVLGQRSETDCRLSHLHEHQLYQQHPIQRWEERNMITLTYIIIPSPVTLPRAPFLHSPRRIFLGGFKPCL